MPELTWAASARTAAAAYALVLGVDQGAEDDEDEPDDDADRSNPPERIVVGISGSAPK